MKGFDRTDSSLIGFATACLFYGAISLAEFHQWILAELERCDTAPAILVDLLEFDGPLAKIYEVIGFVPDWPLSKEAKAALLGIAYRRGTPPVDCGISQAEAEAILTRCPQVESRFKEMFPFVKI